jgi:hypothetical protein
VNHLIIPWIAIPLIFSSCSSPSYPDAISVDRLHELSMAPRLKAQSLRITTRIEQDGVTTTLPAVTTKVGQTAKMELAKDFRYPTAFALAETKKVEGSSMFPVTPTTPTAFDTKRLGVVYTITPKLRGPFIELTGFLVNRRHEGFARGAGEAFSTITDPTGRIVYTDNKVLLPHFTTDEYRVHTAGLPGTEMSIRFDDFKIHITTEIIHTP